ncbi:MAG: hypothetical protein HQL29_04475 [Candidatus Omnitrophica bacterium]|nr:hypothetical protein [Candidatus Omnitrophota bacterium]
MIKKIALLILCLSFLALPMAAYSQSFQHVESLFDLRTQIGAQGDVLPEAIKASRGNDVRTLERIFELNTSALVTIEAYFRIFKISLSAETVTEESISILNEWLSFIKNQCSYDILYLNQALKESPNDSVAKNIETSLTNIKKLSEIATNGIQENKNFL